MTDTQLLHKANGIRRIKQAIKNCDSPVSEVGTVFTPRIRFKHLYIIPLQKAILNSKYSNMWDNVFKNATVEFHKELGKLQNPKKPRCKHQWVMPEDSFEMPYCRHCYKGA